MILIGLGVETGVKTHFDSNVALLDDLSHSRC